jgi:hypothetical protein
MLIPMAPLRIKDSVKAAGMTGAMDGNGNYNMPTSLQSEGMTKDANYNMIRAQ